MRDRQSALRRTRRKRRKASVEWVGRHVAKEFNSTIYYGTIVSVSQQEPYYWEIRYDDGDLEDMEEKEVDMALDEMARSDEDTATVEANAPPRRSNRRKSVVATRSNGVVVDVVAAVLPEESATVEANSPP
jgi:hypothetical protein